MQLVMNRIKQGLEAVSYSADISSHQTDISGHPHADHCQVHVMIRVVESRDAAHDGSLSSVLTLH